MDPSASATTVAVIIAALVVRSAVLEMRQSGSARREWAWVTDKGAWTGGSLTALVVGGLSWARFGPSAVAWGLLAGLLVALVLGRHSSAG
ncbi:hypothetical protein [Streptomyces sp. YS415]|uniref:hypothetical protein n=1 Tax=Streptomyces sp. YS415 TaxID=2944806 RepID=UPI002021E4B8|nr:hypothetical protein [Streptomyces sp. YS415]MCL7424843.1 hypothetical protein [Streptomyces sp. YS415]